MGSRLRRSQFALCVLVAVGISQSGVVEVSAERADAPGVVAAAATTDPALTSLAAPAPATTEPSLAPAPEPAPEPVVAPDPAPAPAQPDSAPVASTPTYSGPLARAQSALEEGVPASWLAALPVTLELIGGYTSYATTEQTIRVSRYHASGSWSHLVAVLAHEFGHIIAINRGSHAYLGAPPSGFPDPGYGPTAEEWADCVEYAFTGIADPAYGMPVCSGVTLDWTSNWLATN